MPEEKIYIRSDEVIVPLVPEPYCQYCCKPIGDEYASTKCCYDCSQNLTRVADPPQEVGKVARRVLKFQDVRPYYFWRAGAVGLYVRGKSLLYREIWRLKNERGEGTEIASLLAECMEAVVEARFPEMKQCSAIVPIPSGSGKSAASDMLAAGLSSIVSVTQVDALSVSASYKSQREVQSQAVRWENPRDKFRVRPGTAGDIRGEKVLLIDDTFVTGGTAHWSAKALLDAGATDVFVLAVGRRVSASELERIGYTGRL